MQTNRESNGLRASFLLMSLVALMSLPTTTQAHSTSCTAIFDPDTFYPALSYSGDLTVDGQAGVFIYLLEDRALIEHDDACLYEVDETVLEIDLGGLDEVPILFELPEHPAGATIYVTRDGVWVETLELDRGSFTYVLTSGSEFGFEIATAGLPAPTAPVLVVKPTTGHPEPT